MDKPRKYFEALFHCNTRPVKTIWKNDWENGKITAPDAMSYFKGEWYGDTVFVKG